MKAIKNIVAIVLCLAFLNVIVGKAVHEIMEHKHVEHTCDVKDLTHFHKLSLTHLDFICDFHFSSTFVSKAKVELKNRISFYQKQILVKYLWLAQNIYLDNLLLRGPPSIK